MVEKKANRSKGLILRGLTAASIALAVMLSGCGGGGSPASAPPAPQGTQPQAAQQSKEPIKIGAVFDISGPGSSLGIPERDSAKMWEEQINAKGGINGQPVKVIILDNESDETKSVLAFKKLANEEKVVAVAGASQSGTSIAMINTATQEQVPLVSAAASISIINPPDQRKWIFKTAQNDSVVAEKVAEHLKSSNLKKIAFLSMNNAFGDSGLQEFGKVAKAAGLEIVATEKFGATDADFTPQLTNVKQKAPDAVVVWAIPPSAAILTKQFKELGLSMPLVHSHGIANQAFIQLAGPGSNGVIFPAGKLLVAEKLPDSDPQKAVLLDYIKGYEKPDRPRSAFGGHGYDAVALIGKAIEKAGSADRAKVRDELEKMQNVPSISGMFNMSPTDHSGISKDSMVLIEIKDGKWELKK